MTRQTSIAVYRQVEEEGLLSSLRLEVYRVICFFGPITQGEAWREHFSDRQRHDIGPRFAELEKRGAIHCAGERVCRLTGREVMAWESTCQLPTKQSPIKASDLKDENRMDELIREEREACARIAYGNGSKKVGDLIVARNSGGLFGDGE